MYLVTIGGKLTKSDLGKHRLGVKRKITVENQL